MKRVIIFAAALCFTGMAVSFAGEIFFGRVVTADPERGTVTLQVISSGQAPAGGSPRVGEASRELTVAVSREKFRPWMREGRILRIVGDYDPAGTFSAATVLQAGYGPECPDPTGVRRRLGRGCGRYCPGPQNVSSDGRGPRGH